MFGAAAYKYEARIIQSIIVRYSSLGNSLSITKLYAIKDNKQTIEIVSFASTSLGSSHTELQQINKIKIIGKIILKI